MNDLISRQAALDIINAELNGWLTDDERLHLEGVGTAIELLPSAQKHGKWRAGVYAGYRCSKCATTWDAPTPYCPNCGARMEVSDD